MFRSTSPIRSRLLRAYNVTTKPLGVETGHQTSPHTTLSHVKELRGVEGVYECFENGSLNSRAPGAAALEAQLARSPLRSPKRPAAVAVAVQSVLLEQRLQRVNRALASLNQSLETIEDNSKVQAIRSHLLSMQKQRDLITSTAAELNAVLVQRIEA
jgi:hypothetical protein